LDSTQRHLLLDVAAAQRAGETRAAADMLTEALRRDPHDHLAATRLAELEIERWDHASAMPRLQAVLREEPNFAPALAVLAHALWLAGRPHEGLEHARRAVAIQPPNPHFRLTLAQLCAWLGHAAEARAALAAVLDSPALDMPLRARALSLLAEAHVARGDFAAANEPFRASLALAPDSAATHTGYAMNLLRLGKFDAAWPEYAWHDQVPFFRRGDTRPVPQQVAGRRWNGEPLHGRTILLWDDQGFGDAIQFFRYVRLIREAGAPRIILCTFAPLASVFQRSAPHVEVVTERPELGPSDFHCGTSDLPAVFRTQLETIPAPVPYLTAPPLPRRLRVLRGDAPRVGLVWSGDPRHLRDHQRSIPADVFLDIANLPGLSFYSLQREVRSADVAALAAHPAVSRIGETLRDFAETATAVARLDLVITVDTAVAHLAGALGRPVWLLLPMVADWRWLTEREDSPWYPTARLFRAGRDGWAPVVRRVAETLARVTGPGVH
jgi:Flp pilus assembly protein TadD